MMILVAWSPSGIALKGCHEWEFSQVNSRPQMTLDVADDATQLVCKLETISRGRLVNLN